MAVAIGCGVFAYAAQHGTLVGVMATGIYLVINLLAPGGLAAAVTFYGATLFDLLNALRIAAGADGALHQARATATTP